MIKSRRIIEPIEKIEIIARRFSIDELTLLRETFGGRNWRKLKGQAFVELFTGEIRFAELHWRNVMESAKRKLKSKGYLINFMKIIGFALCLEDDEDNDFIPNKLYPILEALENDPKEHLRIVDESGEDYLFPQIYFEIVQLNPPAKNRLIDYFESVTV